jgi:hypothetical protein
MAAARGDTAKPGKHWRMAALARNHRTAYPARWMVLIIEADGRADPT